MMGHDHPVQERADGHVLSCAWCRGPIDPAEPRTLVEGHVTCGAPCAKPLRTLLAAQARHRAPSPAAVVAPHFAGVPSQRFDLISVRRTLASRFPASVLTIPLRSGLRSREEDH